MVLAEVDQRPAEHPATHGEQAEPGGDQEHVAEQRAAAALRNLQERGGNQSRPQDKRHFHTNINVPHFVPSLSFPFS